MNKKICYIISTLEVGGAELSLLKVATGLMKEYDFTIISLKNDGIIGDRLRSNGINVICFNSSNGILFFKNILNLYKTLKFIKPDIVHTWMYHSDFFGGIASKILGIKYIYWNVRNTDLISGVSFLTRLLGILNSFFSYFIPTKIVLVSESSKIYHSKIGYCKSKMIVIPNGYDIKLFSDHSSRRFIRKNLSISDSTIIIGSVGRFNKYKDHYTFIKSAIRVLEMSVKELDVKFILIGRNILESNSEIFDLIKNTKYCKNFYLLGEKKDIINYYFSFDIFCLHSISEGFPNVLAEAMATSLPCISTDVGDAKIILNNNTFIALPSDHIDLSNKLINMINLSESQRKYIGQINQRRIESEYSTISFFSKYNNLYRSEY